MKNKKLIVPEETGSVWSTPFYGPVEYEMSKEMAKQILATRKGEDQHSNV